jgi:myosin heavy subunit
MTISLFWYKLSHNELIAVIKINLTELLLKDLFMGTSGILKKLDDLCKLPRTTDASLIDNFNKEFSKNAYYISSKRNDMNFTINHYAGRVMYTSENFLEKNRDSLPFRVAELLRNSSNEIISEIFSNQQSSSKEASIYSSYNMVFSCSFGRFYISVEDLT